MTFDFTDFEMPLLQALFKLGGKARTKDVYPEVEKIMGLTPSSFKAHKHNPSQCDIVICWSMIGLIVRLRFYASRTSLININRMREVDHEQKGITYQRD